MFRLIPSLVSTVDLIPWNYWAYNLYDRVDDDKLHGLSLRQKKHEGLKINHEKRQKEEGDKDREVEGRILYASGYEWRFD